MLKNGKLKNNLFRRSLVCGIILLFMGLSVTSSIHAYTGKISNQSTEEAPANFPLNNDYVNAYWKFDENSGNTLGDSSGHGYDGTIYGATWTTGWKNYALDFDGADDYVDLDDYAKNRLGMNKTDDLVFSFYFRSTSTDFGVIYSFSHPTEYNPGVQIALNSDGTLEFRVWRLGCGILLTSNGTYNDGKWYHGEIFYNGISSNPTVELYVDDKLDTDLTVWVCPFYADQFGKAKIGSRSNESADYFDGKIDELKIIKYPGGNEQEPPTIDGPTRGQPDVEYEYTFTLNDPEKDEIEFLIDWDDGTEEDWRGPYTSGEEVTVSHTWDEDDRYYVGAKSRDYWGDSAWSEHVVKIGNQPPYPPTIDGPKYGDPHEEITYTFLTYDEEDENIKYFIDWDDGTTDQTNYVQSNTSVQLSHSWETEGEYNITAYAEDTYYKPGDSSVYHIRIGDQPPNMPNVYGAVMGYPDIEYEYGFISIDPENDNLTYDIDWDDGNIETDIGPFPSGEIFPRSHSWNETGTYLVKARAKDEFDYYSDWSEHEISVPQIKAVNFNLLELLSERFPLAFLTFKCLLRLLKYDITLLENLQL